MFDTPRYIQNSFNVVFPRHATIRRQANQFEDRLKGNYLQPQIIGIPDELDPEVPRMIFGSRNGFSQLIVSQVSMVLNVTYSPDWQTDIGKGRAYLAERTAILFDLVKLIGEQQPYFCGLSTRVQMPCRQDNAAALEHLAKKFLKNETTTGAYDLSIKRTTVEADHYFSNVTISNYRAWNIEPAQQGVVSVSVKDATSYGVEIVADYNDRYSYNENRDYRTSLEQAKGIINAAIAEVEKAVGVIGG
jgi:hypothetical protein